MSLTRDQVIATLRQMLPELETRYGMHHLALFGSFARGDYNEASDVDIVSDFSKSIGWDIVEICDALEQSLGRKVDVIHAQGLRGRIGDRIKEELLYL